MHEMAKKPAPVLFVLEDTVTAAAAAVAAEKKGIKKC